MASHADARSSPGRRIGLGVVVLGLLVVAVAVSGIEWSAVVGQLLAADPVFVAAALAASLLAQLAWAGVTATTLRAVVPDASRSRVRLGYLTGTFAKQVLPFGHAGGVPLLAYVLSEDLDVDYRTVFASVTASELLIFLASLTVAIVGAFVFLLTGPVPWVAAATTLAVAAAAAALAALVGRRALRSDVFTRAALAAAAVGRLTLGRLVPGVRDSLEPAAVSRGVENFVTVFRRATADRRRLARSAALALLGWLLFAAPLFLSFRAVGGELSLALALVLVPAGGLASLLPTPGGLGGAEVGTAGAAVLLTGASVELAAAGVLLFRIATYWFVVAVGGAASLYLSVGAFDLRRSV